MAGEEMASSALWQTLLPKPEVLGRCPTLFTGTGVFFHNFA